MFIKKEKSFFATAIVVALIWLFVEPFIIFWICYFSGWIAKITIGQYIVEGLTYFKLSVPITKIPLFTGTLGWIAAFFRSTLSMKKDS